VQTWCRQIEISPKSIRTPTTRDCVEYKVEPYFELFVRSSSCFYLLHAQHPLSPHKPYISCITLNVHNVCRTSGMLSCLPYVIPSNYLVCCPIAYYFVIDDPSLTDSGRTMLCTSSLDPTPTHRWRSRHTMWANPDQYVDQSTLLLSIPNNVVGQYRDWIGEWNLSSTCCTHQMGHAVPRMTPYNLAIPPVCNRHVSWWALCRLSITWSCKFRIVLLRTLAHFLR